MIKNNGIIMIFRININNFTNILLIGLIFLTKHPVDGNYFDVKLERKDLNYSYIVYDKNTSRVSENFINEEEPDVCDCLPKDIYHIGPNENQSIFAITNNSSEINSVKLTTSNDIIKINHTLVYHISNSTLNLYISNMCIKKQNSVTKSYWGSINVKIEDNSGGEVNFSYLKFCQTPELMGSIITAIILLMIATLFVYMTTNSEIRIEITDIKPEGEIKYWHGVLLIISGSLLLLLIFYFIRYLNIIFTILVTVQICLALYLTIKTFCENFNIQEKLPTYLSQIISCLDMEIYSLIILAFTVIIVIIYLITRHWILNNIFGFCLIFTILSLFHVRSFKICTILLISAFFYDVFWVYLSPILFKENVMVVAATSLNLPIKLEIPIFFVAHPLKSCMFLGLGDIVLPGLVIKFTKRFDFIKSTSGVYYKISILLYMVALFLSGVVIYLTNHAQPVLFYMCPVLLIGISLLACYRNECIHIWNADLLEDNLQIIDRNFDAKIQNVPTADNMSDIELGNRNDFSFTESSTDSNLSDEKII
jgi:signal peptide peptidase-like protein 2B